MTDQAMDKKALSKMLQEPKEKDWFGFLRNVSRDRRKYPAVEV